MPFLFSLNRTTERGHALRLTFVRKFVGQNAVAVRPGISLILDKFQIRTGQAFADRSTGKGRRLLGSCFVGNSRVGECLLRARCGRPSPCGLVAFALSESARPHAIDCPGTAPNQSPFPAPSVGSLCCVVDSSRAMENTRIYALPALLPCFGGSALGSVSGIMFDSAGAKLTSLAMLAECWLRR